MDPQFHLIHVLQDMDPCLLHTSQSRVLKLQTSSQCVRTNPKSAQCGSGVLSHKKIQDLQDVDPAFSHISRLKSWTMRIKGLSAPADKGFENFGSYRPNSQQMKLQDQSRSMNQTFHHRSDRTLLEARIISK